MHDDVDFWQLQQDLVSLTTGPCEVNCIFNLQSAVICVYLGSVLVHIVAVVQTV